MGYRYIENVDDLILDQIVEEGAQSGVMGISSKRVARACGISSGTIFNRFGTMQSAIDAAAERFDRRQIELAHETLDADCTIEQAWGVVLQNFISDTDELLFYSSYMYAIGAPVQVRRQNIRECQPILKQLFGYDGNIDENKALCVWDVAVMAAVYFAQRILRGQMKNTPECRQMVQRMIAEDIRIVLGTPDEVFGEGE